MSKRCKLDIAHGNTMSEQVKTVTSVDPNVTEETEVLPATFTRLIPPTKAPNDRKDYSVIQLNNDLTALIISDSPNLIKLKEENLIEDESDSSSDVSGVSYADSSSSLSDSSSDSGPPRSLLGSLCTHRPVEEKMAACALCIGVGSFSDPEDIPGLAHFLEHMVFMGSQKYPKENEFDAFIKRKGGSSNASTECDNTTFYFECHDRHLHRGMDMFSQFFISPLMKREAMTREREAIESEFRMSLPSDSYRKQQLIGATGHPNNPVKKFMWGNLKTLRDNVSDDYLYESVHKFWERHYSGHRITVAVQARLPLDILEKWVVECFSPISSNFLPSLKHEVPPNEAFQKDLFCKMYFVEPVKEICELEVSWVLPSIMHLYRSKPSEYLSWIVGHEAKGSLISYLRKNLWAFDISAGHGEDGCAYNSIYTMFTITITLTEAGYNNLKEVLEAVFSYIKMLSNFGPQERLYTEIKRIEDINFQFAEEQSPVDYVENLSENMHLYPSSEYITGGDLYFEYKPDEISKLLELLKPSMANIMVSSKKVSTEHELNQVEPWFQTRYASIPIPDDLLQLLENVKAHPAFHLPEPNDFIPSDFSLLPLPKVHNKYPEKIKSDELCEIYYKQDIKFKLPIGYIGCNLISNIPYESPKNSALQDVLILSLKQLLVEEVYPANMAHIDFGLTSSEKGLQISFDGFNHKLSLLVDKVLNGIVQFPENITDGLFEAMKRVALRQYLNSSLKPDFLCRDVRLKLLLQRVWTAVEKYNALSEATLQDIKDFCEICHKKAYLQCLIQGNISEKQALQVCENIITTLKFDPLEQEKIPEIRVCELPKGEFCCRVNSFNLEDSNCMSTNYYQMGPGKIKEYCTLDILLMLMEEPLFDTLRTQEQLGYDVSCTLRDTFGVLGFSVSVVSQIDKHTIDHIESRITEFLKTFANNLDKMSLEDYEETVASLISLKKCGDVHLKEEVKRNWDEIRSNEYVFNRLEKEIGYLTNVRLEEVITFFKSQIGLHESEDYKKFVLQVVGYPKKEKEVSNEAKTSMTIANLPNINFNVVTEAPGKPKDYFVHDIYSFNDKFNIYPINRVT